MDKTLRVTEHVYRVTSADIQVFLIVRPEGITLIDAGFPGTMALIQETLDALGRPAEDVRDILLTHSHFDHAGALGEIERATGAKAWMHSEDAAMVRQGRAFRPYKAAPGLRNWWFVRRVVKHSPATYEPAVIDHEVIPGQTLPVAGGIKAIGTPGHSAGHLVYLWPEDGGVLFTGDAANNVRGLSTPPLFEDMRQGLESLRKLAREDFDTACFAHGEPIVGEASARFRAKWGGN